MVKLWELDESGKEVVEEIVEVSSALRLILDEIKPSWERHKECWKGRAHNRPIFEVVSLSSLSSISSEDEEESDQDTSCFSGVRIINRSSLALPGREVKVLMASEQEATDLVNFESHSYSSIYLTEASIVKF